MDTEKRPGRERPTSIKRDARTSPHFHLCSSMSICGEIRQASNLFRIELTLAHRVHITPVELPEFSPRQLRPTLLQHDIEDTLTFRQRPSSISNQRPSSNRYSRVSSILTAGGTCAALIESVQRCRHCLFSRKRPVFGST